MKQAWHNILRLWQQKIVFRISSIYLLLLFVLVLLLPLLPLPYDPNQLDLQHTYQPPFGITEAATSHWFGTDSLGRDVLANTLYGAQTALFISVPVMILATVLGLVLGTSAGYFGDKGWKTSREKLLLCFLTVLSLCYYGVYLPFKVVQQDLGALYLLKSFAVLVVLLVLLSAVFSFLFRHISFLRAHVAVPVDQVVMRLTEALSTIPRFVLILVLASFMPPSVLLLSLIIIFTIWTNIARLARAEMMRIRKLPYFEAAQTIGLNSKQLIWRHAMPNLLGPVLVAFTFGLGGLLALESTLSFLNIGVPTDLASWGRTIGNIRTNTAAWWLVAFPGAALTLTILSLYTCSHYLAKAFNEKNGW